MTPEIAAILGAVSGISFAVLVLCIFLFIVKPQFDRNKAKAGKCKSEIPAITFSREESIPTAVPMKVQPKSFFSFAKKKKTDPPGECDFGLSSSGVVYPIAFPDVRRGSVKIMHLARLDEDSAASDADPETVKMSCLQAPQFRAHYSEGMDIINYDEDGVFSPGDTATEQECNLEFTLFYDTETRELHITVLRITGMPHPKGPFRRYPNACVKIRIVPNPDLHWQRTREVKGTLDPVFNETFVIPGFAHNKLREYTVHFVALDYDEFLNNVTIIGEANHPLSDLRAKRLLKVTRRVAKSFR